jgi:hypothetical protein
LQLRQWPPIPVSAAAAVAVGAVAAVVSAAAEAGGPPAFAAAAAGFAAAAAAAFVGVEFGQELRPASVGPAAALVAEGRVSLVAAVWVPATGPGNFLQVAEGRGLAAAVWAQEPVGIVLHPLADPAPVATA